MIAFPWLHQRTLLERVTTTVWCERNSFPSLQQSSEGVLPLLHSFSGQSLPFHAEAINNKK